MSRSNRARFRGGVTPAEKPARHAEQTFGDGLFHQPSAGDGTRAVSRLTQVQVLLETEERVSPHPPAWCPIHVDVPRLRHGEFVGMRVEVAEPARRARDQHDPDDLTRAWRFVVEAGVHHPLFHRGGHAFGAAHPDVVSRWNGERSPLAPAASRFGLL
jgi:hypothetical protein